MEELLKEWIATIAILIYILYPLLKRWLARRKKPAEQPAQPSETTTEGPARQEQAPRAPSPQQQPSPPRPKPEQRPAPFVPRRPTEADVLAAAQTHAKRLTEQAAALLQRAKANPRLVRLVPALRDDLLGRLQMIERSLGSSPTLSAVVQDAAVLNGLQELLRYLRTMAEQRLFGDRTALGDADRMADACYAPILEFARSHGLDLRTSQPVVVSGDWNLSIVPRFASTRVAPLRVPKGFGRSVWLWPAIAHEVAHDLYYSVENLEPALHARLGLPQQLPAPMSEMELDGTWLRQLFGPWLSEIFADLMGTLILGPAFVQTMRRAFRNPASPQRTAAVFASGNLIDEHPPARLRLYMATRVLHHLGRHQEADALWEQWQTDHADVAFYYLPLAGQWVGLSDEALHSIADSVIDLLLQQAWPEFAGFKLVNIPGFAYLHGEHAEVEALVPRLAHGETVHADVRWIMAAAVLATAAQPTLHDQILEAARRSIVGVGAKERVSEAPKARRPPSGAIADALVASVRQPESVREAIILGAAFSHYQRPRWHYRI